jgi:hypothetical protein
MYISGVPNSLPSCVDVHLGRAELVAIVRGRRRDGRDIARPLAREDVLLPALEPGGVLVALDRRAALGRRDLVLGQTEARDPLALGLRQRGVSL